MNGKAAKRIHLAAMVSGKSVKALKREYLALPYHHRRLAGIKHTAHHGAIRRLKYILSV